MRSRRVPLLWTAVPVALVIVATAHGRGHAQSASPLDVVMGVGLPAVEQGIIQDESRVPGSPDAARRRAVDARSVVHDRMGADGVRVIAGKLIVKFREGLSPGDRQVAVSGASAGATLTERPSYANFDVVQIDASEDPQRVASVLAQRGDVEYAQPAHRFHSENFVPNDPLYKTQQWNLPLIDMERAWEISCARAATPALCDTGAGSSITVAVIDSGVAFSNAIVTANLPAFTLNGVRYPALGRQTMPYSSAPQLGASARFVAPRSFLSSCETGRCISVCTADPPLDFDGHGTHVSGTLGQLTNDNVGTAGVAFNVRIMPVKVLSGVWDVLIGCGDDIGGTEDDVARGIRYAADNGAKVINMSLGAAGPPGSSPVIEDAIKYAVGKGVFVAVAAGNDFEDGNPVQVIAEIASRVQGAVSVAAVDPMKNHSFYSSSGSYVELAAPGGSSRGFGLNGAIWQQTFDSSFSDTFLLPPGRFVPPRFDVFAYVPFQGTSQATPHVAGLAALMMQQGITDPAAIEAAMERFATDLGDPGRDPLYGFGLIEARNALRGLGIAK
jgi:serine protease